MAEAVSAASAAIARPESADDVTATLAFPELVYAHFDWFRLASEGAASPAAEERYRAALHRFEGQHGEIVNSYWCTEVPSAVAMTSRARRPFTRFRTPAFTFHRVTDWVTKGQPDLGHGIDSDRNVRALSAVGEPVADLLEHRQRRRRAEGNDFPSALELGQEEDVVDELAHLLDLLPRLRKQCVAVRAGQRGRIEQRKQPRERGAQLVGHCGREPHAQLLVGPCLLLHPRRVWPRS